MSVFTRARYAPSDVTPKELANDVPTRVAPQADYAHYTDVSTGHEHYPADLTLAGLDKALGSRITKLLLQSDAEATLHMGAQILADHAKVSKAHKAKDLQANLMVNVIKEVAEATAVAPPQRYSKCEDLLRRCSLDTDFKQLLREQLFDKNALNTPYIAIVEHD
jgi:hypothetical protein